jgi:biopolymer transport protein ExbD
MGMNVGSGGGSADPEVVVDMNTTPLIDVMLVLLVMLIITIPIQTHAVKLDMPAPDNNPPETQSEPPPIVSLEIDFDGTVLWNGATVASRHELEQRFRLDLKQPTPSEFHIRPNRLVEYKYVAAVLASAQRLGITKIGLVGNEQFL